MIRVGHGRFKPKEERPTLKPNSSTLGTYQGQNSLTLVHQNPFPKPVFMNICGLPFYNRREPIECVESHEVWIVYVCMVGGGSWS